MTKQNLNLRRLGNQYRNLERQIDRGKCVGFYWQGTKLVPKYIPWPAYKIAQFQTEQARLMKIFGNVKRLYNSDEIRQPAIATVNEENVYRLLPLDKTGYNLYQIQQFKSMR